jgi:hypothetical protein
MPLDLSRIVSGGLDIWAMFKVERADLKRREKRREEKREKRREEIRRKKKEKRRRKSKERDRKRTKERNERRAATEIESEKIEGDRQTERQSDRHKVSYPFSQHLPRSRILEKDLVLVCKIVRVGEMSLSERKIPKENYR